MDTGKCIHYEGIMRNSCKAGVNYHEKFGKDDGIACRMPCFEYQTIPAHGRGTYVKHGEPTIRKEINRHGAVVIPCELRQAPTQEQVEADRIESDAHMEKTFAALRVAGEWRVKPKPKADRAEIVECPVCKGRLHLSQSAYNGHVWGKCETADCVSWME